MKTNFTNGYTVKEVVESYDTAHRGRRTVIVDNVYVLKPAIDQETFYFTYLQTAISLNLQEYIQLVLLLYV